MKSDKCPEVMPLGSASFGAEDSQFKKRNESVIVLCLNVWCTLLMWISGWLDEINIPINDSKSLIF